MSKNILLKIGVGIFTFVLILLITTKVLLAPWIEKKMEVTLNEKYNDYIFGIGKVKISFLKSSMTIENLTISSKNEVSGRKDLIGEITSIRLKGIKLAKMVFKKEIAISEVTFYNTMLTGKIPLAKKSGPPVLSKLNIRVDNLIFNRLNLSFVDQLSDKSFKVTNGLFNAYLLNIEKQDTISANILKQFDFEAEELVSISSDSLYTYKARRFKYDETTKILALSGFTIQPNFSDYAFTSRKKYQSDRIEAAFSPVLVQGFSGSELIRSGNLICSAIEIGKMDVKTFRDKRKEFEHINKPAIQDLIYSYPAMVKVDSISILSGSVIYQEHAMKANEPGRISFTELNARIYLITNDTIYKKEKAYLKFDVNAMLMGKGKLEILFNARLFDPQNTFSLIGHLSGMDVSELNPILEKSSFISATSGKADALNFNFTANNHQATGDLVLLYHGLNVALINQRTDETSAVKERLGSFVANIKILDSNPLPGKEVRRGVIDNQRDPEKFLFNYCFRSILSGIKSSLTSQEKK